MDELYMIQTRQNRVAQAVKDYGRRLFQFIRKKVSTDADAEDILQDVWYQFSNISATETVEQVSGWLFKTARNRITDQYRKKKNEHLEEQGYEDEAGEFVLRELLFTPPDNHEGEELQKLFWQAFFAALEALPPEQREAFEKNELEDMTLQEIADKTGENIKTIISRKRYAVQHLRKRLQYLYESIINY